MDFVEKVFQWYLRVVYSLFGLVPIPGLPWLTIILHLCWLSFLIHGIANIALWQVNSEFVSVGTLVGSGLFVYLSVSATAIILEASFKYSEYQKLERLRKELDILMEEQLDISCEKNQKINRFNPSLPLLIMEHVSNAIKIWLNTRIFISPVFWQTQVITSGLATRYIQIISCIIDLNRRAQLLRAAVVKLAEHNIPKLKYRSEVWRAYEPWEYDRLSSIRLVYGRIYELHRAINDCFGWSLLTIFLGVLCHSVCNAYWIYRSFYKAQLFERNLFNYSTVSVLFFLIESLFRNTESTQRLSLHIGCLNYKLVKPLGNKRYNDLVSEFSLQTLHQQFVITAKEFFTLNLSLLGTMVAAIITYLVILIQFMFTESTYPNKRTVAINGTKATIFNN